ncbi:hypothetical protein RND81_08G136000 [Saponaria officinalis]|uniref:Myb-like domain-containing protein n=1 Tax=Saponaria officinalis TaxID=3572 RepID=A0AAW1J8G2_SAPOF
MSSPPSPSPSTPRATAILAVPAPPPPSDPPPPRKFPAPCWTHDETLALISSYQDKWYSLRRRNLRTADWDAVAEEVTRRCPGQSPPKTSAQCRHKMEKLRKRYRTEKQRISSLQNNNNNGDNSRFFGSSWVLFDLIHSMELGSGNNGCDLQINNNNINKVDLEVKPFSMNNMNLNMNMNMNSNMNVNGKPSNVSGVNDDGNSKKPDLGNYFDEILLGMGGINKGKSQNHEFDVVRSSAPPHIKFKVKNHHHSRHDYGGGGSGGDYNGDFDDGDEYIGGGGGGGGRGLMPPPGGLKRKSASYDKYDEMFSSKMMSVNGSSSRKDFEAGSRGRESGLGEMVASIKMLGEGLVKMEKMKIEMMRDIEKMRMEMEMKRSEMILESQHLIVNAFINGLKKSKKVDVTEME